jgi:phage terminase small subunit
MKALNERQRDFVRHLVTEKPGYGALTSAYRKAGYGRNSKASTLSKEAHHMSRDQRIIAAIAEESRKVIRVGHPEARRCST